jgi:hypothetical protein
MKEKAIRNGRTFGSLLAANFTSFYYTSGTPALGVEVLSDAR